MACFTSTPAPLCGAKDHLPCAMRGRCVDVLGSSLSDHGLQLLPIWQRMGLQFYIIILVWPIEICLWSSFAFFAMNNRVMDHADYFLHMLRLNLYILRISHQYCWCPLRQTSPPLLVAFLLISKRATVHVLVSWWSNDFFTWPCQLLFVMVAAKL